MRMSRRMCLYGNTKMNPDSVTVNSGSRLQYWSSGSATNDKWHNTSTNPGGVPFTNYVAYIGRNSSGAYHQTALCFKTGDFTGKSQNIQVTLTATSKWGWSSGMECMWQISRHDWSTAEAWQAGSKGCYSTKLGATPPADPNAVAHGSFTAHYPSSYSFSFSGEAVLKPNTEYVMYIWATGSYSGKNIEVRKPSSTQPVIKITG